MSQFSEANSNEDTNMLTVEKKVHQPGRGHFSTVYFNGYAVAEKYDGQTVCFVLQRERADQMRDCGVPMDDNTIDWTHAAELLR